MAAAISITGKVEYALMGLVSDEGAEELCDLYAGQEFEEVARPSIHCVCNTAVAEPQASLCYRATARIVIYSAADKATGVVDETIEDDSRDKHHVLAKLVQDALDRTDLVAQLTDPDGDFTMQHVNLQSVESGSDGRQFFTVFTLDLFCIDAYVT